MNVLSKIEDKNIVIATHVYTTGPSQQLRDYLIPKVKNLFFIGHPFSYCEDVSSFFEKYQKGKMVNQKKLYPVKLPGILMFFKDAVLTLVWVLFSEEKYDIFFGVNILNAFVGLILKKLGKVERAILYTIDFIPQRFPNKTLNWIYHQVDNFCIKHCDLVWNLSPVMVEGREKKGISSKYKKKQIEVPVGTDTNIEVPPFSKIDRYTIAFMGHLRKEHRIPFLVDCLPDIIKKIPQAKLLLVGGGPLEAEIREYVERKGLKEKVEMTGFVKDPSDVNRKLAGCAIAVAPYEETAFVRYTDPGKPKVYLACGLPVVITKIVSVAFEVEKAKCGFAIGYTREDLINAIVKLLKDEKLLKAFKKNAVEFAKKYTWDKVFGRAFETSLREFGN